MKAEIRVTANAGTEEVSEKDGMLIVKVKAPAKDNKANMAVLKVLKKHFKRDVRFISGLTSKRKIVEISD